MSFLPIYKKIHHIIEDMGVSIEVMLPLGRVILRVIILKLCKFTTRMALNAVLVESETCAPDVKMEELPLVGK